MRELDKLFVFRKVQFNGQWHLRCINCSKDLAGDFDQNDLWNLYVNIDKRISVSIPKRGYEVTGFLGGPSIVYGMDPVIEALPTDRKTRAIVAQNYLVVVSDDDLSELTLPRFFSVAPNTVERIEVLVKFTSPFLEDLPDVRALLVHMTNSMTDNELRLFGYATPKQTRIPVGLLLPATMESNAKESSIVYSIANWRSDTEALVEIYSSDHLVVDDKMILMRSLDNSSCNVLLGRVFKTNG